MLMHGWCISYYDNTTNYCTNYDRSYLWQQMAGQELRRSYTQVELLPRNRHFDLRAPIVFQPPHPQTQQGHSNQVRDNRRRYSAMPTNKVKHATMEIYRPPNVRVEGSNTSSSPPKNSNAPPPKLNVHAKEFTMNRDLSTSRSSGSIVTVMNHNNNGFMFPTINGKGFSIQHSKSSGNVLHALQQSKSSGNVLHGAHNVANQNQGLSPRVHFRLDGGASVDQSIGVSKISPPRTGLKRSKSLSATDALRGSVANTSSNSSSTDLGVFPVEMHDLIQRALQDPNELSARALMQLVKLIMERAADSRRYAEPAAKLCINIIEKEKKETFLESLLNMCQLWYQERDKLLKSKYPPFMGFLNEMYCQLKRSQLQLKTHYEGVPPPLLILTLLSKCCQDCLKPPGIQSLSDIECLFFVLTSIGRDLEQEMPKELEQVLAGVRDAFLTAVTIPAIRKTLLQLIELHAAKWQLPASAVMYYYPGTSR